MQLWATQLSNDITDSVLQLVEQVEKHSIRLELGSSLEGEAAKIVALEQIRRVEDTTSEVLDVDTGEVIGLAVEVASNVQELWVQGSKVDNISVRRSAHEYH